MYIQLLFLNMCFVQLNIIECLNFKLHPDSGLSITKLIRKYGYPVETHTVLTKDGYFIKIFRIPHGRNSTKVHKYPVMLMPGTCGCSENFVATGPDNAIGFYLADKGFDVWLTNTRGNIHARKHKVMKADYDHRFWDFSWHEVAVYDTPALFDYILNITGASKLFYIGHSQGTTSFFAFAAEMPEYNDKVKLSINMGPSCFLEDNKSVVKLLGKHSMLLEDLFKAMNFYQMFPKPINSILNFFGRVLCAEMTIFIDICYLILYFTEYSSDYLIQPMHVQLALQSFPSGCSSKELFHYFQIVYSGKFRQYDYGPQKNLKHYGTVVPPMYNLTKITSPTSLFVAENDNIIPAKGVRKLNELLPNVESLYSVPSNYFNHVDFIFSNVTKKLVNKPIYDLFMKYINKDNV